MGHRYAVGDQVRLAFGFHDHDAVGLYEVTRLLPYQTDSEPQYRVRGSDDRERVIGETQISGVAPAGNRPAGPRGPRNPITEALNRLIGKKE
ncbi:hypothetical protein [Bosea sp. Root483D1]|uniref:hypothetical protein n=1 Tax=Bosea sp. Root483D1 TaxID=1736544 RepID=UPI0012E39601|nr:hypothetical protein [Bosea sp. Root483D1]